MASTSTPSIANLPTVDGGEQSRSVFDSFRISIAQKINKAFPNVSIEKAYESIGYSKKDSDFTVALPRFKLGGKPADLGAKFKEEFTPDEWIESVETLGGFLTFKCRTTTLAEKVLYQIEEARSASIKREYGHGDVGKGKKLVIEYSSPGIAKEFHAGHLRSTIIGAFLANLYRACGWKVISLNCLEDWGEQFGLLAIGYNKYGDEKEMERDPIKHLHDIYVRVSKDLYEENGQERKENHKVDTNDTNVQAEVSEGVEKEYNGTGIDVAAKAYFKRMESGDEGSLVNWRKWRHHSIEHYERQYKMLNVHFDEYLGESMVSRDRQMEFIDQLERMGLVLESKGTKMVDLEKWKMGKAVLLRKDGTITHLTRDLVGAMERWEKHHFDKMVYVSSSQQDLHVSQSFKILELMGFNWVDRLQHINYGLVSGMSTHKGTPVSLNQIIEWFGEQMMDQMKANEKMFAQIEDPEYVCQELALTAIKIQDMATKRVNGYTFNWARMTSCVIDTGPSLQYAHVRFSSLERKNAELLPLPPLSPIDFALLDEPKARDVIFHLGTYPDAIRGALKTSEPSGIVTYCMKLSHYINSAWDVFIVEGEPNQDKARARMWLLLLAREVLGAGMRLLTLTPLSRM